MDVYHMVRVRYERVSHGKGLGMDVYHMVRVRYERVSHGKG